MIILPVNLEEKNVHEWGQVEWMLKWNLQHKFQCCSNWNLLIGCSWSRDKFPPIRGATVVQWIQLRLPSCHPGFESQAHHLRFYQIIFELWHVGWTKINRERPGLPHFLKKFHQLFCIENSHHWGKYHCMADLLFNWLGFDQTSKYVANSTWENQLNSNKINSSAVQRYFPILLQICISEIKPVSLFRLSAGCRSFVEARRPLDHDKQRRLLLSSHAHHLHLPHEVRRVPARYAGTCRRMPPESISTSAWTTREMKYQQNFLLKDYTPLFISSFWLKTFDRK